MPYQLLGPKLIGQLNMGTQANWPVNMQAKVKLNKIYHNMPYQLLGLNMQAKVKVKPIMHQQANWPVKMGPQANWPVNMHLQGKCTQQVKVKPIMHQQVNMQVKVKVKPIMHQQVNMQPNNMWTNSQLNMQPNHMWTNIQLIHLRPHIRPVMLVVVLNLGQFRPVMCSFSLLRPKNLWHFRAV